MINHVTSASIDDAQPGASPLLVDPSWSIRAGQLEHRLNSLTSQDMTETREQLVQAGKQFEAYFVSYLLKVMRETVPEGALANKQGAYFYSFYDEEIGLRAAESGGIGIAKMIQEYAEKHFSSPPSVERSSSGR